MAMRSAASAAATASGRVPSTVKATVGVRPSIAGRPVDVHARHRRQALEQRGEHLGLGLRRRRRSPSSRRNRAAASTAAIASKLGVPGLPLARPAVGRRADLGDGQLVEQRRVGAQHAGVRAVPLVRAAGEDVAAEGADVDRLVRREVHGVDEHAGAGVVGGGDDRGEVGHRADEVGRAGQRDPARALVDEGDHGGGVEQAGAGSNGARTCSAPAWSHARRHGVTLASWSRRGPDDAIAGLQRRPRRPG